MGSTLLAGVMFLTAAGASFAGASDVHLAREAARGFLTAVYQNDGSTAAQYVLSDERLAEFIGEQQLSDQEKARVASDIAELEIDLAPGYERFESDGAAEMPEGAVLRFVSGYRGVPMVLSLKRAGESWRVDLRWWAAMIDLARGTLGRNDPEFAIKNFLLALIGNDRKRLKKHLPRGTDLEAVVPRTYEAPSIDHLYRLAAEMPVVELDRQELVLDEDGRLTEVGTLGDDRRVYSGVYGSLELVFFVVEERGSWKVLPQDYLARLELR